jgi:hypothetical protein
MLAFGETTRNQRVEKIVAMAPILRWWVAMTPLRLRHLFILPALALFLQGGTAGATNASNPPPAAPVAAAHAAPASPPRGSTPDTARHAAGATPHAAPAAKARAQATAKAGKATVATSSPKANAKTTKGASKANAKGNGGSSDEIAADFGLIEEAVANHLKGQVKSQGGEKSVIRFMLGMARDKKVVTPDGTVTMEALQKVWTNKTDSQKVEDAFRAARPNEHEWIPSNLMVAVISRAQTSAEGEQWVYLQDRLRAMTEEVIFKPQFWSKDEAGTALYPNGHVGALEKWFPEPPPGQKATGPRYIPLQVGMEEFHNELREAFQGSKNIKDAVTRLHGVFQKWVWNGESPPKNVKVASDAYFHREHMVDPLVQFTVSKDEIAKVKANYATMEAKFNGILAEVKQAMKDDASEGAAVANK